MYFSPDAIKKLADGYLQIATDAQSLAEAYHLHPYKIERAREFANADQAVTNTAASRAEEYLHTTWLQNPQKSRRFSRRTPRPSRSCRATASAARRTLCSSLKHGARRHLCARSGGGLQDFTGDRRGVGIYDPRGRDPPSAMQHHRENRGFPEFRSRWGTSARTADATCSSTASLDAAARRHACALVVLTDCLHTMRDDRC